MQAFEEERRKAKKEDVTKLFGQMLAEYEDYKEYISLEKLYDNRWENATASMKSIKAELTDKMNGIRNAITMIKATRSDKEADALESYKRTLDLNGAIQMITIYEQNKAEALKREEERRAKEEERKRLAEIERARAAEREAILREEQIRREERERAEKAVMEEKEVIPDICDDDLPFEQPTTVTAYYKVIATPEELESVEMAFNSIGVCFERREK